MSCICCGLTPLNISPTVTAQMVQPHTCGPTFGRFRSYFELTQALISYRHSTEDNKTEPWTPLFSAYFKTSCMTRGNRAL